MRGRLGGDSSLDDVDSILSLEGVGIFRFELDKELQRPGKTRNRGQSGVQLVMVCWVEGDRIGAVIIGEIENACCFPYVNLQKLISLIS